MTKFVTMHVPGTRRQADIPAAMVPRRRATGWVDGPLPPPEIDLDNATRAELDEHARLLGIDTSRMPNKETVRDAIRERQENA